MNTESNQTSGASIEQFMEPSATKENIPLIGYPSWIGLPAKASQADALIKIQTLYKRFKITPPEGILTGSPYTHCPECVSFRKSTEQPSLQLFLDSGQWICHHCGYTGDAQKGMARKKGPMQWVPVEWNTPKYQTLPLTSKQLQWFSVRGISQKTLEHFHIQAGKFYIPKKEEIRPCMIYPYFYEGQILNIKFQDSQKNAYLYQGAQPLFFGLQQMPTDTLIIALNELDVLSFYEAGFSNVIGLPYLPSLNEAAYEDQFEFLLQAEKHFTHLKKIIFALGSSDESKKLAEELARRLGKERCWQALWNEEVKSVNEMLVEHGVQSIQKSIQHAKAYPIIGIFEASDVYDRIDALYNYGLPRGSFTGWAILDEHYTVKEGQWTLVTGIPGHGKSNFLDAMLVNIADKYHWRFGMFSPENQPVERHFANLMEKYADAPFSFGPSQRMTEEQKEDAKQWVNEHFFVILPDDQAGNWSIDGILALAKALIFRKGIKGLVIDPWNELDHTRSSGFTETEHISQALTKIRQFARSHGVHIWVVAHPAKLYKDADGKYPVPTPYDVSGSSHWNNKADNAICVWRNRGGKDDEVSDIHIQKIRFKEIGRVGRISLRYDKRTGRFVDDIDQNKRQQAMEKGLELPTAELRLF